MSKAASGLATKEEIKLAEERAKSIAYKTPNGLSIVLPYTSHLSFFFDPIPSELLPKLFKDHPVWFDGNLLYEHIVDSNTLPAKVLYRVVESPSKTEFMDAFTKQHNWTEHNPELFKKFRLEMFDQQWKNGEIGFKRSDLVNQIRKHRGHIAEYYKRAVKRDDFQENKEKYAANVAHLNLYPIEGKVNNISAINVLLVGNDIRTPVAIPTK